MSAGGRRIPFACWGALGASHFRRCIRFGLGDGPGRALSVLALSVLALSVLALSVLAQTGPLSQAQGPAACRTSRQHLYCYDICLPLFHHYS